MGQEVKQPKWDSKMSHGNLDSNAQDISSASVCHTSELSCNNSRRAELFIAPHLLVFS